MKRENDLYVFFYCFVRKSFQNDEEWRLFYCDSTLGCRLIQDFDLCKLDDCDVSRGTQSGVKSVSRPLKDLVNDPPDYLDEICKRLDASVTGVGNYEKVAKYYKFDMDTIFEFEKSPGGPSKALISAIS